MPRFTPPPADAVRARLLDAARDEFAEHGVTGAKVERIAAAAGSNKAQLFHYFGGKDGLYEALYVQTVTELAAEVPLDVDDLPEYAGRLHDVLVRRPWVQRLTTWHRLEGRAIEALAEARAESVAAVERAQRAGVLPRSFRPAVLLGLVEQLAAFWAETAPEGAALVAAVAPPRRRQVVVDAVAALLAR
ncbi:AcrR family transcriptional regulator [Curtobacterium luteum]|uniref:AcrR family transcriptional regulator n=1 Tax=Curtobacterium luteum TaxID=33881 RepID=A0A8H9GDN8_9MICO|nr:MULTISPECIES: TetR family transcriptional regulator [Curtobacterium]MBM7802681.1 AcrR family transcriptional regulator [Curtobacterium luteum]NUU49685.1 TetR family transcriptional regulator [Curtobacterium luteum]GGL10568.1 hypothetical protein GCM10009769_30830 [Curtobacterium luteum]